MSYSAHSSMDSASRRYSGWLPSNPAVYDSFVDTIVAQAIADVIQGKKHQPAVQAFKDALDNDMISLFDQMFMQASKKNKVPNLDTLLYILDIIIVAAPPYHVPDGDETGEPIGVPIYLFIDLLSNTAAGYDLFRIKKLNEAFEKLLNAWKDYLQNPKADSNKVLNRTDGWFSNAGITSLESKLFPLTFDTTYKSPKPQDDNRGFATWDAFFIRELQPHARPVDLPKNQTLIHSACESTVYRIAHQVKAHDQFWLKAQKYSLYDMLNKDDKKTKYFDGGTVYQAFLSPLDYHRWHSPIAGRITKVVKVPGTYYAVLPDEGAPVGDPDFPAGSPYGALIRSQPFLTLAAARALIYIQADNDDIGELCFIAVGMIEVSNCELSVKAGDHVDIGQQLGMFHFGGSTYTLIFNKDCNVAFASEARVDKHVWINSIIAQVLPKGGTGPAN